MAKVMNTVFGIGIAVLLFIVVMLGTQVFYKEPTADASGFNCTYPTQPFDYSLCAENITIKECNNLLKTNPTLNLKVQADYDACWQRFNEAEKTYGKNLFIINNVAGIVLVIVSMFLFAMINIAAGTAFAGLALIIYGFMRGWQGTGDVLKFIVALIVAALFITFAVIVNKRYSKKSKKR